MVNPVEKDRIKIVIRQEHWMGHVTKTRVTRGSTCSIRRPCNQKAISCVKGRMSPLVRAKHPKIVLGVVGAALALPVLGITISLVGASANTQQEVSMQDVSMEDMSVEESAQNEVSAQHETVPRVAAGVVESQPAQSPLPDPLAPEPTRDSHRV